MHRHTYIRSSIAGRSITTIAPAALRLRFLFGNDFHPMVPDSLKGFQPDFREQSELVHSHFRATAVLSPLRARLSETRKGNFIRKTNTLIRVNSQAARNHWRFFFRRFSPAWARELRCALKKVHAILKVCTATSIDISSASVRSFLFRWNVEKIHVN